VQGGGQFEVAGARDANKGKRVTGVTMQPSEDHQQSTSGGELNGPQRLRLRVSCQYIDKLLTEVESILHDASSRSPFGKYIVDVNPDQTRVLEDYIQRIRGQLLRSLAWQGMKPEEPRIPATRAVLTNLSFIDIAVEELRPRYMRGAGPVGGDVARELNGVVHELRSLLEGTNRYLRQEMGTNLEARLTSLQQAGADVSLLQALSRMVTEHGFVEFRGRIEALTARLEDPSFEVALFGRVSSGKSSLLNALLGVDILPVGVNPITAVPTKLRSGPFSRAVITFADGRNEAISLHELAQYVSEESNLGNQRNVVRALAEISSPRLQDGIVLVDTPGLGSLARRGATETLAYLPSADLGLVLIDAGSTLSEEDIGTLRLLYDAGIPPLVLLSKADLLAPQDVIKARAYTASQLQQQLGVTLPVHPVSALPSHSTLLDEFFDTELLPRFDRARLLRDESVSRKTGSLRNAVVAAMETVLDRERLSSGLDQPSLEKLEMDLRRAIGEVGEQPRLLEQDLLMLEESSDRTFSRVAEQAFAWSHESGQSVILPLQISEWTQAFVREQLRDPIRRLRESAERAILSLQQIAAVLHASDTPSMNEVEALLRDLPRFELVPLTKPVSVNHWVLLGDKVAVSRVRSHLKEDMQGLKQELHSYGRALYQWAQQTTRNLERLVSSYADGYRIQIHRLSGSTEARVDADRLRRDLDYLLQIGGTVAQYEAQKSA
jgi:GTP-binding protein EngB required for normal cell division